MSHRHLGVTYTKSNITNTIKKQLLIVIISYTMKMKCICIAILTYFFTDTPKEKVLSGKDKYLLEKLKNTVSFKTNVNSKESVSSKDKK